MKREGDGASPVGIWALQRAYYRADRVGHPPTALLCRPSRATDGWCEEPGKGTYNRLVRRPSKDGHETFWREDGAYDIVISTNHNSRPRIQGFGSAIFFHLTRPGSSHTAGCIAVSEGNMRKVLQRCGRKVVLVIWPPEGWPPGGLRKSRSRS